MTNRFEIDKLPKGHHLAIEHECFNYESWNHYLDSKSTYHFDKYQDDDNHPGINLNLKFRWSTDITKEIFPFVREKSRNVHPNDIGVLHASWWYHKMEVRGLDHVGFKESVKPEKHPTLQKIVDWFEFAEEAQPVIMEKGVGQFEVYHVDTFDGHPSGYGIKELVRVIIHLQDWQPGQFMVWGNKNIQQWQAGDCIAYDKNIPHATANSSRYRRYSLRITGVPSNSTLDKLKKGGVITIK